MAWIELHQSLPTHRKTLEFADALDITPVQAVGHVSCLWLWALDNAPDGDLSAVKPRTLARAAMWDGDPGAFLTALEAAGFVLAGRIHDWSDYTGRLIEKRRADVERKRQWRDSHRVTTNEGTPRGRHADATRNGARTVPNLTVPNHESESVSDSLSSAAGSGAVADATEASGPSATAARAPTPDAPPPPLEVPERLGGLHAVFVGLRGYEPSAAFFAKVAAKYGHLDLEEEAIKAREWLSRNRKRDCSPGFVLNWLKAAAERESVRPIEPPHRPSRGSQGRGNGAVDAFAEELRALGAREDRYDHDRDHSPNRNGTAVGPGDVPAGLGQARRQLPQPHRVA